MYIVLFLPLNKPVVQLWQVMTVIGPCVYVPCHVAQNWILLLLRALFIVMLEMAVICSSLKANVKFVSEAFPLTNKALNGVTVVHG